MCQKFVFDNFENKVDSFYLLLLIKIDVVQDVIQYSSYINNECQFFVEKREDNVECMMVNFDLVIFVFEKNVSVLIYIEVYIIDKFIGFNIELVKRVFFVSSVQYFMFVLEEV